MNTCQLLQLPPELLLHSLSLAHPRDVGHFAATSNASRNLCTTPILWRNLHSVNLDSHSPTSIEFPYRTIVERFTRATTLLEALVQHEQPIASTELVSLLETLVFVARSRSASLDSLNESFLERYLSPSSSTILTLHPTISQKRPTLRSKGKTLTVDPRQAQLASLLHTLSTPALLAVSSDEARTAAREIAYERLNFTRTAGYGPLVSDSSGFVDYRKTEAISLVMRVNLEDALTMGWGRLGGDDDDVEDETTTIPSGWSSTRTGSATINGDVEVDPRDWAGLSTHEWRGTYAFLHYPVYHHFNHHRTSNFTPSLAGEDEAVGDCMSLKLELLPEGQEVEPPMLAFGDRREGMTRSERVAGRVEVDSDDEDDVDFEGDTGSTDEGSMVSTDSDEEDDGNLNIHFNTRNAERNRGVHTPSTSPPEDVDIADETVPGPLPLPSSSTTSPLSTLPNLAPSSTSSTFPKLSFFGSSMPLQLRTLNFTGTFRHAQTHFNVRDRSIRGTVEMNERGEVVWRYIIRYGGIDQWAMTGVQIGGPRSKFGVVGTWTCADRTAADEDGPNGPFWYWPHLT